MGCQVGFLALFIVSFSISSTLQSDESLVPVLIWNYRNTGDLKYTHNSLHNVDTPSFSAHLQKIIAKSANPLVLVFIEPTLSVEDFSSKPTAFENVREELSHSKLVDYITSVDDASKGVHNLADSGLTVREISDELSVMDNIGDVDVLIVKLSESDDKRFNMLQKHDRFISEAYRQVYKHRKNVIGLLTGELSMTKLNSLFRYRRAAEGSPGNDSNETMNNLFVAGSKNNNGRAMFYSKTPAELILPTGTKFTLAKEKDTEVKLDDRKEFQRLLLTFNTPDKGNIKIRMRFDKDASSSVWMWNSVEVEAVKLNIATTTLTTSSVISSPIGSKFTTTKEVEFTNAVNNMRLVFPGGFDVQAYMPDKLGLRFGDAPDAPQYFTPGIWMGIFVMAILSLVFTLGLIMMMDIRTMDRFDDAKGKTITINATE